MGATGGRGRLCLTCAYETCECDGLTSHELTKRGKILTVNAERAANRWVRAEFVREWRTEFSLLARGMPRFRWVSVTALPFQQRGRLQDVGACLPAVKAAIDGLVDRGVVPDDDARYVRSIVFHPPRRGDNGLTLVVTGPED